MPWIRHDKFWGDQKIAVYRSRYDEAARIVGALRARRESLFQQLIADDLIGKDTTLLARRLRQTDDELDLARTTASAAFAALQLEDGRDHHTHQPREARR
jgi:hypothetical protein